MDRVGDGPVHGRPSAGPQRPEDADKDLRSHHHRDAAAGAFAASEARCAGKKETAL